MKKTADIVYELVIEQSYGRGYTYGFDLHQALPWWRRPGLYPALMRLEHLDLIQGEWEDGVRPRRRRYMLT